MENVRHFPVLAMLQKSENSQIWFLLWQAILCPLWTQNLCLQQRYLFSKLTLFFGELLRNFRNTLNINCLVLAFYLTNFRFIFLLAKHIIELSKDLVQSILQKFNYGKHRFCSTEATKSLVREYPKTSINSTFSRINFLNRLCLEYQNSKSVLIEVFEFWN